MAELPWFEYAGESPDELFALARTHRIDSLVAAFEMALEQKVGSLSVVERDVLAIEALEREVNNGGFHQFFENSSGKYAGDVAAALTRIGCPRTAAAAARALAALPPGTPLTPEALEEEMAREDDRREAAFAACDQAYYASAEDIAGALFAYLQSHRGEVRFAP